jgi:16S rRNA (uracil1498-N3)-methyltransferase
MDGIIRHATELGAGRIVPFFAERSVPRWQPEQLSRKRERWRKIAVEASRQCGRSDITEIGEIVTFERMLLDIPESGLRLIPWEEETARGIREVLRDPARVGMKEFILVIGPEGGFSVEEIERARRAGFLSVSLGKRVLRVETASLAVLAILQYEKGGGQDGSRE